MGVKNFFRKAILNLKIGFFGMFPFLASFFYKLFWSPKNPIEQAVSDYSKANRPFCFLQIGANDGIVNDPIMKFIFRDSWTGIRVEPLSAPFEKLRRLHRSTPKVKLVQGIVADKDGTMPLYHLSFSTKRWATGLASLQKSNLERQIENGHIAKRAKKYGDPLPSDENEWITSIDLNVTEINKLIQTEFGGRLNLLQVDTEGFDHVLVKALQLDELTIDMICFEKLHIPDAELDPLLDQLKGLGYEILFSDMDILAYKPKK